MMQWIDTFLDRITMYRLLLYVLIGLELAAFFLAVFGVLHFSPLDIAFSGAYLTAVCWIANKVFGYVFDAPTNVESPLITALILALIISPTHTTSGLLFLTAAGGLAIASKFILAIRGKHLFNPAAIAVVLTSYGAGDAASWWVGTAAMLPFVLVGGVLLIRRIRHTEMVLWFLGVSLAATMLYGFIGGQNPFTLVSQEVLNSALFFAGFIMLTEPLTSPTTRGKRVWYSAIVGLLFPPQFNILGTYIAPEVALVVGNIFTYIVGPRTKSFLELKDRIQLSRNSMDFIFTPQRPFAYEAGQYMEFTFQHPHTDSRGARRYFTLASSPTEPQIRIGLKFYEPGSSFKRELLKATSQTPIVASQLGGDFTLPKDQQRKLVFIAGGIGITPFRSMLKYLVDTEQQRDVTLIYSARSSGDIVYQDVFEQARVGLGAKLHYFVGDAQAKAPFTNARINVDSLQRLALDKDSLFYISGPHDMVVDTEKALHELGVPALHIKKDFFSGYA